MRKQDHMPFINRKCRPLRPKIKASDAPSVLEMSFSFCDIIATAKKMRRRFFSEWRVPFLSLTHLQFWPTLSRAARRHEMMRQLFWKKKVSKSGVQNWTENLSSPRRNSKYTLRTQHSSRESVAEEGRRRRCCLCPSDKDAPVLHNFLATPFLLFLTKRCK